MNGARAAGILVLAMLGAMLVRNVSWVARHFDQLQPLSRDRLAPGFQLPALDGASLSLDAMRGRPVVLVFWATWCGPCRAELPHLMTLQKRYADRGLQILAINDGEDLPRVKRFVQDSNLTLQVLWDEKSEVAARYGRRALPFSVFIDRQGYVRDVTVGPRSERRLAALMERLMAER